MVARSCIATSRVEMGIDSTPVAGGRRRLEMKARGRGALLKVGNEANPSQNSDTALRQGHRIYIMQSIVA